MLPRSSRLIIATVVTLALCSSRAHAIAIQGKWGLGAPIFSTRNATEISLLHGTSHGALGLDFTYVVYHNRAEDYSGSPGTAQLAEQTNLTLGPRLRRFMLSDPTFSPYFDVFLYAVQSQSLNTFSGNTNDTRGWGGAGGIGLGMEYLTPWHFSVAAHSDVASVSYIKFKDTLAGAPLGVPQNASRDRTLIQSVGGFSAQLVARGYF